MKCYIIFASESEAECYQKYIGESWFEHHNGFLNALGFTYSGIFD